MKKVVLIFVAIVAFSYSASAQMSKGVSYSEENTIGLRLGYGGEISYQRTLSNANRIEADLGFMSKGFSLAGIYQWAWTIDKAPGLGWYVGPGVAASFREKSFSVGILGQIGLEYSFDIPLTLSIDWRPGYYFSSHYGFSYYDFALGVKYRF